MNKEMFGYRWKCLDALSSLSYPLQLPKVFGTSYPYHRERACFEVTKRK